MFIYRSMYYCLISELQ